MSFPIGIHSQSIPLISTCMDMMIEKHHEYKIAVERLLHQIFENEDNLNKAVADNRLLRIYKDSWNPIEEEIYLDGHKIAEFKIIG